MARRTRLAESSSAAEGSGTGVHRLPLREAAALRWGDLNLDGGTARIARSYSSGTHLGPTKTGLERVVELSSRLRSVLAAYRPAIFSDEALVFPNQLGSFLLDAYFRNKVFNPCARHWATGGITDRMTSATREQRCI